MAQHLSYYDDWKISVLTCPKCGWTGRFEEGVVEYYNELCDCSCPNCEWPDSPMLAIVSYPTIDESRKNWNKLSESERKEVKDIERFQTDFKRRKLRKSSQLPEINSASFVLEWDFRDDDSQEETLIKYGETIIFAELAFWEGYTRYIAVAKIIRARYGTAVHDLVPTYNSLLYLYGDVLASPDIVAAARKKIFFNDK